MEKLTYKQAYDKIIQAYFKDEIKPFDAEFCFCGTLNHNENSWIEVYTNESGYSRSELMRMEAALYSGFFPLGLRILPTTNDEHCTNMVDGWDGLKHHHKFEDSLFAGMCAALEVLKEIHRARGEDVDEVPMFTKRELSTPLSGIKN